MWRKMVRLLPGRLMLLMTAAVLIAAVTVPSLARAAEIIPSLVLSKPVNTDDHARLYGGLAFRGELLPAVQTEIGVMYRSEDQMNGEMQVRMWPVTASLWLQPVPALYAGGGVGWYHTTLHYRNDLGLNDDTSQRFGAHVGGGLRVPLSPSLAMDLHGRYVFMKEMDTRLLDFQHYDPDFWMMSLGLSIGL